MKILLVSYSGYGAWFTLRLLEEGHSVDYYLLDKKYSRVLKGIAPAPLTGKPTFSDYDLVVFDLTGKPRLAEEALKETPTIGDGNLQSQLEDDRLFGIEVMEQVGVNVPLYEVFSDISEAKAFIKETKKRYVFKPFGGQDADTACTYVSESAEDLLDYLDKLGQLSKGAEFLLQEVVEDGVEISTEGWFNGEEFFLLNSTLEEKKFLNDNLGPNTGCAGNIVWTYSQGYEPRIFREGLGKMKEFLKEYEFRGMIDLNTIVSPTKVYGLEWTPRFGYDASATLFSLIDSSLGDFLVAIGRGDTPSFNINGKFAASIRLSIPPYPLEEEGFAQDDVHINGLEPEKICREYYLYDAMLDGEDIVTAGINGFVVAPIAVGSTVEEAFELVCKKIKCLKIPDLQYRTDLCKKTNERYEKLLSQGWL